jgi:hypothetical protein
MEEMLASLLADINAIREKMNTKPRKNRRQSRV